MSKKNIINPGYFNTNNKKNSILENAKYQNNEFTMGLNKIELLSQNIRIDLIKKDKSNNVVQSVNFQNKNTKK